MTRPLVAVLCCALVGCVLEPVPENTLAGTLVLSPERLALLEEAQAEPPGEHPEGRFGVDMECQDGEQVVRARSWLDAEGRGLFEIVLPPGTQPEPWTCSFSAPAVVFGDCGDGRCPYDTRFAVGTLRTCDEESGVLFSWDGTSRWLGEVVADGTDACAAAPNQDAHGLADVGSAELAQLALDAPTWCGTVTLTEAIDSLLGTAVGWSPYLCFRLFSFGGEDFVQAGAYRGIELGERFVGCPLLGPIGWKVLVAADDTVGFTSRPPSLGNGDIEGTGINLSAVLWEGSGGMQGRFLLSAWSGVFDGEAQPGVPGGMVLETSGPMVDIGAVDIPPWLLRDSVDGCTIED